MPTDPFKNQAINRLLDQTQESLDTSFQLTKTYTEEKEAAKREFAIKQEWSESGQRKSRNVPPRPKKKRKPKGPKTHRK